MFNIYPVKICIFVPYKSHHAVFNNFTEVVGFPLLRDLQNHFTPQYAAHWRKIGIQLHLQSGTLDIIEHDNHHKAIPCCDAMLSKWLEVDQTVNY